ncbi:MAG: lytic transglycosylase domain-containing protein [Chloroflexota bacterium]|nr:lytic transglycosylase domain-containing protein [Chloroflexota bacterium]
MRFHSPDRHRLSPIHSTYPVVSQSVRKMGLPVRVVGVLFAGLLAACTATTTAQNAPTATVAAPTATVAPTQTPRATEEPQATTRPEPTATPAPDWTALPVAADNAAALGKQLAMVEVALRDPNVTGAQLAHLGHLEQLCFGRLADYPEWKDTVLAALPDGHRTVVANGLEAGKQLRTMYGAIPKTLPDWKIVAPAPIDELLADYKAAEAQFGVPWQYLAAIHLVETRMGRIRGLSSAGAQGPMQFMPATWAGYGRGGDINNTHDAIFGAANYLKASGAPANMSQALFAYNHSLGYVNALIAYATAMKLDQNAFRGYYGWQVYYPTLDGPIHMPVGWVKQ